MNLAIVPLLQMISCACNGGEGVKSWKPTYPDCLQTKRSNFIVLTQTRRNKIKQRWSYLLAGGFPICTKDDDMIRYVMICMYIVSIVCTINSMDES